MLVLLLAVLVFFYGHAADAMYFDKDRPVVTTFGGRLGHHYMVDVDQKSGTDMRAGIAILITLNEVAYAKFEYNKHFLQKQSCLTFETLRGTTEECKQYFLLASDYFKVHRVTWKNEHEKVCGNKKLFQIDGNIVVLVKYDVQNAQSDKFVGTYNVGWDTLIYAGTNGERLTISHFKKRIANNYIGTDRYEVLCLELETF